MLLTLSLLLTCVVIIICPRQFTWPVAFFSTFCLSLLYVGFQPTIYDDLYKHYIVLNSVRQSDYNFYYLTNEFRSESPVYYFYLKLLSFFGYNWLLPVVTSIIVFFIYLFCIKKSYNGVNNGWGPKISIILMIITTRYIDISAARNILSSAIFVLGLYYDLILHNKKSYILYILSCGIHYMGFIYLMLRLMLIIYNKLNKWFATVFLLIGTISIALFYSVIANLLSKVPILSSVFARFGSYLNGEGLQIDYKYTISYIAIYLVALILAWFVEKYFDSSKKFVSLYNYLIIYLIFTFCLIFQRETFNRGRFIILPISLIFLSILLRNIKLKDSVISIKNTNYEAPHVLSYSLIIIGLYAIVSIAYFFVLYITTYRSYSQLFIF